MVAINTFPIFTEDEIKQLSLDDDGNVHTPTVNSLRQLSKNSIDQFSSYSKTGDCAVWLVSEYVYKTMELSRIAKPLAELYETLPEGAYDAYAVKLSETEIYQYYDVLKLFPEDTLIVMPHNLVWGTSSDKETYQYFCDMFRAIVDFRAP